MDTIDTKVEELVRLQQECNHPTLVKDGQETWKCQNCGLIIWGNREDRHKINLFQVNGYELIEKTVTGGGNSGRVYVPPAWIGCHVAIVRLDEGSVSIERQ